MKPWTEEKERKPNTVTQSRRVLRKKSLRSETNLSKSSKCQLFLSHQNPQSTLSFTFPNIPSKPLIYS